MKETIPIVAHLRKPSAAAEQSGGVVVSLAPGLGQGRGGRDPLQHAPEGDPNPSLEDLQFTRRLADAAAALGVGLVDHRGPVDLSAQAPARNRRV